MGTPKGSTEPTIAEMHNRGANILKLRDMAQCKRWDEKAMAKVGKLYGYSADDIADVLSVGAANILAEAGIPLEELGPLEAMEKRVNSMLNNEREGN